MVVLVADQAGDYGLGDGGDDPVEDRHEGAVKQSLKPSS